MGHLIFIDLSASHLHSSPSSFHLPQPPPPLYISREAPVCWKRGAAADLWHLNKAPSVSSFLTITTVISSPPNGKPLWYHTHLLLPPPPLHCTPCPPALFICSWPHPFFHPYLSHHMNNLFSLDTGHLIKLNNPCQPSLCLCQTCMCALIM